MASVLAIVSLAACSDATKPDTEIDITGTYALSTIDGKALPFLYAGTFFDNGVTRPDSIINSAGSVTINAGGTFRSSLTQRHKIYSGTQVFSNQTQTFVTDGTYVRNGTAITFSYMDEGVPQTVSGTATGSSITVTLPTTIQINATQTITIQSVQVYTK